MKSSEKTTLENTEKTLVESEKTALETNRQEKTTLSAFKEKKVVKEFPAEGGEADIFLLEDNTILKLYRKGIVPKEEVIEQIQKLSHKLPEAVIRIIDFGIDVQTGRFYEIQEYARFGNIKQFLKGKAPNFELLKQIVKEINENLKAIHSKNIIHRDLKPANILVRKDNPLDLVFSDFGISSILDPEMSKKITSVKGTPVYSAPESFSGIMGKEADYWSFGMIILDLLGKNPFKNLDVKTIIFKITAESVPIVEDIDERVKTLLKGLLTQNRKKRWGYQEVEKWLRGESVEVYYGEKRKGRYRFNERDYYSLDELARAFHQSYESFEKAGKYIGRGHLSLQLKNNEEYDLDLKLSEKVEGIEDPALMVIKATRIISPEALPSFYGVPLKMKSVIKALINSKKGNAPRAEVKLATLIEEGKFYKYAKATKDKRFASQIRFLQKLISFHGTAAAVKMFLNQRDPRFITPTRITPRTKEEVDALLNPMTKEEFEKLSSLLEKAGVEITMSEITKMETKEYALFLKHFRKLEKEAEKGTKLVPKKLDGGFYYPYEINRIKRAEKPNEKAEIIELLAKIKEYQPVEKEMIDWAHEKYLKLSEEYLLPRYEFIYLDAIKKGKVPSDRWKKAVELSKKLYSFLRVTTAP